MDTLLSTKSIADLCRICTRKASCLWSMFDQTRNIPELVWLLAKVEIKRTDELPQQICSECLSFVENAFEFKERCLHSELYWQRNWLEHETRDQKSDVMKFEICMIDEPETKSLATEIKVEDEQCQSADDGHPNLVLHRKVTENTDTKNVVDNHENQKCVPSKIPETRREVQCSKCNDVFTNQSYLRYHINSDHADENTPNEKKIRKCFFCPKEFSTFQYLSSHLAFHKRKVWTCALCDKDIEKKCLFVDHLRMHAKELHYKCDACPCAFTSQAQLRKHKKTHFKSKVKQERLLVTKVNGDIQHGKVSEFIESDGRLEETSKKSATEKADVKPVTCSICKESFQYPRNLNFHLKSEHVPTDDSSPRIHHCGTCNKTFMTLEHLVYHMKFHKKKSWSCPSCNKQFKNLYGYKLHQLTHQNNPNVLCPYCGKFFLHKSNVKTHINRQHIKKRDEIPKKEYVCEICGVKIKRKTSYDNHMNSHGVNKSQESSKSPISTEKGKFVCNICGKNFRNSGNYEVHMRRHLGISICSCLVCGKGFPCKQDLTVHMRNHTGDRPFECPTCNMKFITSQKLRIHLRVHTGEKPFTCPCGMAYSQGQDLKAHKKRNTCGQNFDLNELNAKSQWSICIQPSQPKNDSTESAKQMS
ncbi:gastrula zinc finger protein XlCGF57.1-like isoform X1 [Wyeomyia smithii]|uniref:gastrula zinc finger protein XlCGF57.1-like isoform X1 n=1 Tax=Wyeomyia smithii TaxID=174621 RepID=UPI002467EE01|nr:gastrula zinc finger protein XlCGF57.1-like isoform X1 [Wyeomyia smithii]